MKYQTADLKKQKSSFPPQKAYQKQSGEWRKNVMETLNSFI